MLKTIEATAAVYPAPVLIVGTYGKISYDGMDAIAFVSGGLGYHVVGERVGNAFRDGAALK